MRNVIASFFIEMLKYMWITVMFSIVCKLEGKNKKFPEYLHYKIKYLFKKFGIKCIYTEIIIKKLFCSV